MDCWIIGLREIRAGPVGQRGSFAQNHSAAARRPYLGAFYLWEPEAALHLWAMDLAQASVCQFMIPVEDLNQAIKFYRDTLGIPFLFTAPPQMAFFQCGSVRLLVGVLPVGSTPQRGSAIYFQVADIHDVFQTLSGRGVQFQASPHVVHRTPTAELLLAEFKDPNGNQLALMGQKPITP